MEETPQFSQESHSVLELATDALVGALRRHVEAVGRMHGGSAEMQALFAGNEDIARAARDWNERFADHTGTWPLLLDDSGAGEDDGLDDEDDEDDALFAQGCVSVVSRWDLAVVDRDALLAAGRDAHRRNRQEETEEDASFAVRDASSAIYAILHEAGEPWWNMPGLEVLSGARNFVIPDEPLMPEERDASAARVETPPGRTVFAETWA